MSELNLTLALFVSKLKLCIDFQLIVGHIQGKYKAKDEHMSQYLTKARDTLNQLNKWAIKRIPNTENIQVDVLARVVATLPMREAILLLIHLQPTSSIAITHVYSVREKARSGHTKLRTTSGHDTCQKITNMHIGSGCKLPISLWSEAAFIGYPLGASTSST